MHDVVTCVAKMLLPEDTLDFLCSISVYYPTEIAALTVLYLFFMFLTGVLLHHDLVYGQSVKHRRTNQSNLPWCLKTYLIRQREDKESSSNQNISTLIKTILK